MENKYSTMIDFFSMIISGLTLLMTYKISTRANNISKNSVRPYLDIIIGDYNNHTYIKIKNNGLGTAIIKNIDFIYENKLTNESMYTSDIITIINEYNKYINPSENDNKYVTFVEDIKGRGIGPQDEIIILEKRYECTNSTNQKEAKFIKNIISPKRKKLLNVLKDLKIKVEYTNVFGDEIIPSCERELHFFGRNLLEKKDNCENL
ncbi:MAG: hypothetical protein U0M80_02515 [Fusobacterium mortiferum]|uniref:hypothetical protein n=1 Tax=uncultured Fusobacterium sp. TaxID=159267 RepID=UPI0025FB623B|nr:hypothetical protein [uncultured Fusobacterium sp.]